MVQEAAVIERDATLTCPPETENRCAIPSEFQDLADSTFTNDFSANMHYVSLLEIGEDALLSRIHLIRAARESIELQVFIWDDDEIGQMLFMEMLEAARRGVKVRMLLDQFGTYVSIRTMAQMATVHENIDVRFFRPAMKQGGKSPTREVGVFITDPKTLNKRMHNKLMVIDGRIGIVGGRNIQETYFDYSNKIIFKDLDILVVGPTAQVMVKSFNKYWDHRLTKPVLELSDIANQAVRLQTRDYPELFNDPDLVNLEPLRQKADLYSIISSQPAMDLYPVNAIDYVADWPDKRRSKSDTDRWDSTRRVEELVTGARYEVLMQTPYLIQDRKGIRDFKKMRKKNPDLRIALSTNSLASTDMFYVYAMCFKQRQFYLETVQARMFEFKPVPGDVQKIVPRYSELLKELNGIESYEDTENLLPVKTKKPRMIVHSKFFIVDNHVSFVGSHNFDPRAKNLNTENAVIVWNDAFAAALKEIFERDTAPQNSWSVARRQKVPVIGNVSELIALISSSLPFFDVWPFEYSTNFNLKPGYESLDTSHPDFYEHYQDVGIFPEMGLSYQDIGTRFVKAFGGLFRDLM